MVAWFDALNIFSRIFLCIAVPATLLLILQLILMLVGLGQGGADSAESMDGAEADFELDDAESSLDVPDGGLRLFTLWGMITFFTIMGWSGFAMVQGGMSGAIAIPIALVLGFVAMVLLAMLMRAMLKLQQDGALNIQNTVGRTGEVYLTIPAARMQAGKITLVVQDRYAEFSAVTDEDQPISTGMAVDVIGVIGQNTLLVRSTRTQGEQEGGRKIWHG